MSENLSPSLEQVVERKHLRHAFPWRDLAITAASFLLAFFVGAILMIVADPKVMSTYAYFFSRPSDALGASWGKVSSAYGALFEGSLGGWQQITETTAQAAPLIAAGLGVGLGFRAGLFNIGAQGQAIWGAIVGAWIGFALHLPTGLHLAVAVLGGVLGGAVWAGIAGFLKARFGAHEVITTIMLNYVAMRALDWLLSTKAFMRPDRSDPIAPVVDWNATMPRIAGSRLHLGFLLVLLAALGVWWLLERSTVGFHIRAVGANPSAAGTAGMSVARTTVIAMALAGGLAGLAGALTTLAPSPGGMPVPLSAGIVGSIGFDAITVALLGRSKPLGTVFAGLLFGAMHAGGLSMQSMAGTPLDLTTVLQALIVIFVAAPRFVTTVLPFLTKRSKQVVAKEAVA